ncbi:MATE family efflux transporter [Halapricum hydrolyticum]|uniref:MATE family efflux transporter n=1 Tax=Halapricum hydrolyticum TaxID=2979991 RepID=A0AAE3ICG7_9EURY|nr:MATE family efflux transporter [Halapricum hydrolyticum]MCU4716510.1 MATE family efflux transporter [Halapricum hydrolyticum]MCU4725885.1 MATE family efflux transporter [Halapricum hydrolyticum]
MEADESGHSVNLTEGPLLRPLIALSLPIVASQLLQVTYNLADTFWVGRLGQNAVTALSLSLPFVFLMVSLGGGLTVAGTVLVSQNTGAGNTERVSHVAGQTIAFVSLVSIGLASLGFVLSPVLLPLIGGSADPEAIRLAVVYTRIIFVGVVFMFGFQIFQALLRGYGDTVTPMYLMGASVTLNVLLDPFLILGFRNNLLFEWAQWLPVGVDFLALQTDLYAATGFAGLGVTGAAVATVVSRGIAAAIGFWLIFTDRVGLTVSLSDLRLQLDTVKKIIDIGVPTAAEQSANSLAYTVMTALAAMVSGPAVAAYGIGNRINTFVFLPAIGLARGTETAVGQNLGAGKNDRAKRAVLLSTGIVGVVFGVVSVLVFLLARPLVTAFIPGDPGVIRLGTDYFKIIGPTYVFMGAFQVINAGFRGAGSTRTAMVFSIISQWGVRIPPTYLLITVAGIGAMGVWGGIAFSHVAAAAAVAVWYVYGDWAENVLEEDESSPGMTDDEQLSEPDGDELPIEEEPSVDD